MIRVIFALLLMVVFTGCAEKEEAAGGHETQTASEASSHTDSHEGESQSMIPDKVEPPTSTKDVYLRPFFDEQGTVTEIAAAPGETFTLYIHAEYKEPYHMSAAEFSFQLPAGIKIISTKKFLDRVVSVGEHTKDYILAFGCEPPRKFFLVKYTCTVDDAFTGGTIELAPGVSGTGEEYFGFVSCKPGTQKIPAEGGAVTLKKK